MRVWVWVGGISFLWKERTCTLLLLSRDTPPPVVPLLPLPLLLFLQVYLDYGGSAPYSEQQLEASLRDLGDHLLCNPHRCAAHALPAGLLSMGMGHTHDITWPPRPHPTLPRHATLCHATPCPALCR